MIPSIHNFNKIKRGSLLHMKHGGDKHQIKQMLDRGVAHENAVSILNSTISHIRLPDIEGLDMRSTHELNIYSFSEEHLPFTTSNIAKECSLEDIVTLRIFTKYVTGIQQQAKTRIKRYNAISNPVCQSIIKRNSNYIYKLNNLIESYYTQMPLPTPISDK